MDDTLGERALCTWGWGKHGLLGHGTERNQRTPRLVRPLATSALSAVACGWSHSLALTTESRVFSWGWGLHGQLGHNSEVNEARPREVLGLDGVPIVAIAAGCCHSAALSYEGEVFTWGWGINGRLGHADRASYDAPKQVASLRAHRVVRVACGDHHSACVTVDGEVFTWGWGKNGQLGHGTNANHSAPKRVEALRGLRVLAVACGWAHTVVLCANGDVYAWGSNEDGQLGLSPSKGGTVEVRASTPKLVSAVPKSVVDIACGSKHTAVVTNEGHVYTWGMGRDGQLGHGSRQSQGMPTRVEALGHVRVVEVAAGDHHTAAVDDQGVLYTWGGAQYYQLGHGPEHTEHVPRVVEQLDGCRVGAVSCGAYHTAVIVDIGRQRMKHLDMSASFIDPNESVPQSAAAAMARQKPPPHEYQHSHSGSYRAAPKGGSSSSKHNNGYSGSHGDAALEDQVDFLRKLADFEAELTNTSRVANAAQSQNNSRVSYDRHDMSTSLQQELSAIERHQREQRSARSSLQFDMVDGPQASSPRGSMPLRHLDHESTFEKRKQGGPSHVLDSKAAARRFAPDDDDDDDGFSEVTSSGGSAPPVDTVKAAATSGIGNGAGTVDSPGRLLINRVEAERNSLVEELLEVRRQLERQQAANKMLKKKLRRPSDSDYEDGDSGEEEMRRRKQKKQQEQQEKEKELAKQTERAARAEAEEKKARAKVESLQKQLDDATAQNAKLEAVLEERTSYSKSTIARLEQDLETARRDSPADRSAAQQNTSAATLNLSVENARMQAVLEERTAQHEETIASYKTQLDRAREGVQRERKENETLRARMEEVRAAHDATRRELAEATGKLNAAKRYDQRAERDADENTDVMLQMVGEIKLQVDRMAQNSTSQHKSGTSSSGSSPQPGQGSLAEMQRSITRAVQDLQDAQATRIETRLQAANDRADAEVARFRAAAEHREQQLLTDIERLTAEKANVLRRFSDLAKQQQEAIAGASAAAAAAAAANNNNQGGNQLDKDVQSVLQLVSITDALGKEYDILNQMLTEQEQE